MKSAMLSEPSLGGNGNRFRIVRRLGAGGMGVVYAAEDRERGELVALKTLKHTDYETMYRMKREFRALADLAHPNLVNLYDLFVDEATCFFTMELVDGSDLLTYVKADSAMGDAQTMSPLSTMDKRRLASMRMATSNDVTLPEARDIACDERLLRLVLPQLAEGLSALHEAGKIHRDIKPSNIVVTHDGRVVLLDFGLVANVEQTDHDARTGNVVGTVAYMAPEQAVGDTRLGPAADWYSMGVILYQALTGRVPFSGPALRVLEEKQQHAPPPPRAILPRVPKDLDDLCVDLLASEPKERPTGAQIRRRLGLIDDDAGPSLSSRSRSSAFTGRHQEMQELDDAYRLLDEGRPVAVILSGPSGIGKSTLASSFLDGLRWDANVLVLAGRCYEREAVPYKAMDTLIDQLSGWWLSLPGQEARELLPREAALLPTLFPVLGRVPSVVDAPRLKAISDPQELRTHGFQAVRELLQRIADRRRLILFLDDTQWVDANTMTLLADVMRPPDPPRILLLLSGRDEGAGAIETALRRMDVERRTVQVGPLPVEASHALARRLLGDGAQELAAEVAREAAGSPFFLIELARHLHGRDVREVARQGLDAMVQSRIGELPEAAQNLLQVVAVAGEPISQRAAATAAGLTLEQLGRQARLLRTQHFLRAARLEDHVEPYHDRIRQSILGALPDERAQRHHRGLAIALTGEVTNERLARHWRGAGEPVRAAEHAQRAGDEAVATLDFDRAGDLYRMALELGSFEVARARALRTTLGETLMLAGRPHEAAEQFLLGAEGADRSLGLDLRRRAADALLRGGYLVEGMQTIRTVLDDIGLRLAVTPRRAITSLLARRAWLRLRGLGYKVRPLSDITQEELARVDVREAVAMGLSMVDTIRSTEYTTRYLSAALKVGEPRRLSTALALEASFLAAQQDEPRALEVIEVLAKLNREQPTTATGPAMEIGARGFLDFYCRNRWRTALERFTAAENLWRERAAQGFEINTAQLFACWALTYLGELGEVARRVPQLVTAAERRGDRYGAVTLRCGFQGVYLVRDDDPLEAERQVVDAIGSWSSSEASYHVQHLVAMYTRCDLLLYAGRWEQARSLLERDLPEIRRALLDRVPFIRGLVEHQRAKVILCELAAATERSDRDRLARAAESVASWQSKSGQPLARAHASLTRAGLSRARGDEAHAAEHLRQAIAALDELDTNLYANASRRRLGETLGGTEGAALLTKADYWMHARGVRNPARMTAMLIPGWPA
jgi:serine/threonine protein kinase